MKNALLLLVILAASVSPVAAQSSADGLDSTLVAYYRWCNRHKQDPEMLLKADTMFRLAGEKQNRRMQAVALCLKTDYYYYTNKFDSVKVWVARTQQFTRQHYVLQGGVLREEVEVLEHQPEVQSLFADLSLPLGGGVGGVPHGLAVHPDAAGVRPLQKVQAAQQGGLAGAGRADDGQRLALL